MSEEKIVYAPISRGQPAIAATLPDGKRLEFDGPVTGREVAAAIGPGLARRVGCPVDLDDPAFQVGSGSLVFAPHGAGQNDIGEFCGFGEEEIDHDERVQALQRTFHYLVLRQRNHQV